MSLLVIALVVLFVVLLLTNTKRWKAIGAGVRKSRRDLGEEIRALEDDR